MKFKNERFHPKFKTIALLIVLCMIASSFANILPGAIVSATDDQMDIKATKVWVGGPESTHVPVTFSLYTGSYYVRTMEANADNDWTATWQNMNVTDSNGEAINYQLVEQTTLEDYSSSISGDAIKGFVVTNTYTAQNIDIKAKKVWEGGPASTHVPVTLSLYSGSNLLESTVANASNSWTVTWTNIPIKDADGVNINYTVKEENPPTNYTPSVTGDIYTGFTVKNTYLAQNIDIKVKKVWDGGPTSTHVPVVLSLYNGLYRLGTQEVNASNSWTVTWQNMPIKDATGETIKYTVSEENLPANYTPSVTGDIYRGFTVTNSYGNSTLEITKIDRLGKQKLSGAKFELRSGNIVLTSTVGGSDGISVISNIPSGSYELVETQAPTGYNKDASITITMAGNEVRRITVENSKTNAPSSALYARASYINGYPDGSFRPAGKITRAEIAQILSNILINSGYEEASYSNQYKDIIGENWYNKAVATATKHGVFKGYDTGNFKPNGNITKAELTATVVRLLNEGKAQGNSKALRPGHWARGEVERAYQLGWLYEFDYRAFNPDEAITREEVVQIVNRALRLAPDTSYINENQAKMTKFTDVPSNRKNFYEIMTAGNTVASSDEAANIWVDNSMLNMLTYPVTPVWEKNIANNSNLTWINLLRYRK